MVLSLIPYHVQQTSHLCLYRLCKKPVPPTLFFPKVKTVALIHCSSAGISNILRPSIFPNLSEVHYLSAHPGRFDLHTQFQSSVSWVFPNLRYAFYQCMIEAGHGRVENQLIRSYIHQFVKFPRGAEMMIHLPGYDMIKGSDYSRCLRQYLYQPKYHRHQSYSTEISEYYSNQYDSQPSLFDNPYPYFECGSTEHSLSSFFRQQLEKEFMDYILSECEEEMKNK
jgi:hypothetical protein